MSDAPPPLSPSALPSAATGTRRLTLATTAGIALVTFLVGLLLALWVIDHVRGAPQPAAQPQAVAAAPPKVIVAPPVATDPASLSARQEMLSAQLAALEQRGAAITAASASAYGNASRAEALLIAFAVRRAIDRGQRLDYLEQQLRDRFGATHPSEVALVIQAGAHPVSAEDLRLGLDQIGPQLALGPTDGSGWGGAFGRMLGSLVVVHRKDTPSPVAGERLNRIRRMLALGQVEAASEEVGKLPGAAQATGWMTGARQYVAVRKALDTIEAAAIQSRVATPLAPAR